MSRNTIIMEVLGHNHPLKLIDLELKYQHNEEEDVKEEEDEDDDDIIKEEFRSICDRCDQDISEYHRYYYTCIDSCDFSLHKFCAEAPKMLNNASYPFPLRLASRNRLRLKFFCQDGKCNACRSHIKDKAVCYIHYGIFKNKFIHIVCAIDAEEKRLYHPSHPHQLAFSISKPILCDCNACGKVHKGMFYSCTTCSSFTIHSDCAFLPKKLLIQQTTNKDFIHTHPLTLSYSFPVEDQMARHFPSCRVCRGTFLDDPNLWIYKCDKCRYYAHLDCATSRREPFMSFFSSAGVGKLTKNFEDADYPNLLHLPFPDQSYSIPKHLLHEQTGSKIFGSDKVNLKHDCHEHPLILVENDNTASSTSSKIYSISCHDPMKKIELLCNGCLRPITSAPFYKCANEEQHCNFVLHEWCTRLPTEINHPEHNHTLILITKHPKKISNVFRCYMCGLVCNGFSYGCFQCEYFIDISCGLLPQKITHDAHPNHLLSRVKIAGWGFCGMCFGVFFRGDFSFSCNICDFHLHLECAYLSPRSIRHKFDKHPLNLMYLPVENHKSEYFCEICETELNPEQYFYHCHKCVQSIHTTCASVILQCETANAYSPRIRRYLNIKFEGTHTVECHPHPLSFVHGIESDGVCDQCNLTLEYKMIFRCGICKYAIDFRCCARSSHSSISDDLDRAL